MSCVLHSNLRSGLLARPNTSCRQTNWKRVIDTRNHVSTKSGEEGRRTQAGSTCSTWPRGPTAKTFSLRVPLYFLPNLAADAPFQMEAIDKHLCSSWPPFLQEIKLSLVQNRFKLCTMLSGLGWPYTLTSSNFSNSALCYVMQRDFKFGLFLATAYLLASTTLIFWGRTCGLALGKFCYPRSLL